MPHFPRTPEALIGRNDSKNPASTCRGITSAGRACRRSIASSRISSVGRGTSSLSHADAPRLQSGDVPEVDFYCWQHKDQANLNAVVQNRNEFENDQAKRRPTQLQALRERTSIDTLVQKLGIDSVSEDGRKLKQRSSHPRPPRKTEINDYAVQLSSTSGEDAEKYDLGQPVRRRSKKKPGFWASLCCMTSGDDDYVEIVRHRKRTAPTRSPEMSDVTGPTASTTPNAQFANTSNAGTNQSTYSRTNSQLRNQTSSSRPTNNLLSLIPQTLPPQTTSALLAELVKPISPYDEEGYIYIFWLTPSSHTPPAESTAKSLLAPDSRPQNGRRISDVMTEYSFNGDDDDDERHDSAPKSGTNKPQRKTIMLKIGRANNITRRMNEWQRQCGYALNLVRWYPYISTYSSSPTPSPQHKYASQPTYPDLPSPSSGGSRTSLPRRESEAVHKCPHIHRVERLIHLELASQQVRRRCGACGKEHREWFEVAATQAGVRAVDEVVRRWVGWAERGM